MEDSEHRGWTETASSQEHEELLAATEEEVAQDRVSLGPWKEPTH